MQELQDTADYKMDRSSDGRNDEYSDGMFRSVGQTGRLGVVFSFLQTGG